MLLHLVIEGYQSLQEYSVLHCAMQQRSRRCFKVEVCRYSGVVTLGFECICTPKDLSNDWLMYYASDPGRVGTRYPSALFSLKEGAISDRQHRSLHTNLARSFDNAIAGWVSHRHSPRRLESAIPLEDLFGLQHEDRRAPSV